MVSSKVGASCAFRFNMVRRLILFFQDLLNFDQCLDPTGRCFGPLRVLISHVFYESELSFALVNLKPIVPGMRYDRFHGM